MGRKASQALCAAVRPRGSRMSAARAAPSLLAPQESQHQTLQHREHGAGGRCCSAEKFLTNTWGRFVPCAQGFGVLSWETSCVFRSFVDLIFFCNPALHRLFSSPLCETVPDGGALLEGGGAAALPGPVLVRAGGAGGDARSRALGSAQAVPPQLCSHSLRLRPHQTHFPDTLSLL